MLRRTSWLAVLLASLCLLLSVSGQRLDTANFEGPTQPESVTVAAAATSSTRRGQTNPSAQLSGPAPTAYRIVAVEAAPTSTTGDAAPHQQPGDGGHGGPGAGSGTGGRGGSSARSPRRRDGFTGSADRATGGGSSQGSKSSEEAGAVGQQQTAVVRPDSNPAASAPVASATPLLGSPAAGTVIPGRYVVFFHSNVTSLNTGLNKLYKHVKVQLQHNRTAATTSSGGGLRVASAAAASKPATFVFKVTASIGEDEDEDEDDSATSAAAAAGQAKSDAEAAAASPPARGLGVASTGSSNRAPKGGAPTGQQQQQQQQQQRRPKGAVLEVPQGLADHAQQFMQAVQSADDVHVVYPDRVISIAAAPRGKPRGGSSRGSSQQLQQRQQTQQQPSPQCAPSRALAGFTTPAPDLHWRNCKLDGTAVFWFGERCGANLSKTRWLGIYALNTSTAQVVPGCLRYRKADEADSWNRAYMGGCGVAPTAAPGLPVAVCPDSAAAGCIPPGKLSSLRLSLNQPVTCSTAASADISFVGKRCGPGLGFVQWTGLTVNSPGSSSQVGWQAPSWGQQSSQWQPQQQQGLQQPQQPTGWQQPQQPQQSWQQPQQPQGGWQQQQARPQQQQQQQQQPQQQQQQPQMQVPGGLQLGLQQPQTVAGGWWQLQLLPVMPTTMQQQQGSWQPQPQQQQGNGQQQQQQQGSWQPQPQQRQQQQGSWQPQQQQQQQQQFAGWQQQQQPQQVGWQQPSLSQQQAWAPVQQQQQLLEAWQGRHLLASGTHAAAQQRQQAAAACAFSQSGTDLKFNADWLGSCGVSPLNIPMPAVVCTTEQLESGLGVVQQPGGGSSSSSQLPGGQAGAGGAGSSFGGWSQQQQQGPQSMPPPGAGQQQRPGLPKPPLPIRVPQVPGTAPAAPAPAVPAPAPPGFLPPALLPAVDELPPELLLPPAPATPPLPEQQPEQPSGPGVPTVAMADKEFLPTGVQLVEGGYGGRVADLTAAPVQGIVVAVVDTGVDQAHPDLNVVGGMNMVADEPHLSFSDDSHGHGTHVAGTIGAKNQGKGIVGVAPGVGIYGIRVLRADGNGAFSDLVRTYDHLLKNARALGIRVVNLSLSGSGTDDDVECQYITQLIAQGMTVVTAAGNSGISLRQEVPAACPGTLVVTAISDNDGVASSTADKPPSWSNFLPLPDTDNIAARMLAAPGDQITSTYPMDRGGFHGYARMSGTSMACPHVSGVVALCYASGVCASNSTTEYPAIVVPSVQHATANAAFRFANDPLSSPLPDKYYGHLAWARKWWAPSAAD